MRFRTLAALALLTTTVAGLSAACGSDEEERLTIYSGRAESLVHPILEQFSEDTGIKIDVKYGGTAELAATILEEGDNTPADVFYAQDAGALGALQAEGRLAVIPQEYIDLVPMGFHSPDNHWVGTSGRARVIAYNTETIDPETDLPDSIHDFTNPEWSGRVGWAPTNGSFQAFVTALRVVEGEEGARAWLEGMLANDVQEYPNNITIVQAVADGEIDAGFVNHYYLYQFLDEEGEDFAARNYHFTGQDIGNLVNVAGLGIIEGSDQADLAEQFVEYMLSETAQQYFADETHEYPVIEGIDTPLPPLASFNPPDVDLGSLSDLQGTITLLQEVGALP